MRAEERQELPDAGRIGAQRMRRTAAAMLQPCEPAGEESGGGFGEGDLASPEAVWGPKATASGAATPCAYAMDRLNLTGAWWGRYLMPNGKAVAFWAAIEEAGGVVTGGISGRYQPGANGEMLNAAVRGTRAGLRVAFVKAYDGAGRFAHAVDYADALDPGGERMAGRWTLAGTSGAFETRQSHVGEEEEVVRQAEVEVTT